VHNPVVHAETCQCPPPSTVHRAALSAPTMTKSIFNFLGIPRQCSLILQSGTPSTLNYGPNGEFSTFGTGPKFTSPALESLPMFNDSLTRPEKTRYHEVVLSRALRSVRNVVDAVSSRTEHGPPILPRIAPYRTRRQSSGLLTFVAPHPALAILSCIAEPL